MKRVRDLLLILGVYIIAFVGGYFSTFWINNLYLMILMWDVVATVITFIFSLIFRNSSVYDPYWSVAPMVFSFYLFFRIGNFTLANTLFLACINIWGARLTINWITTFHDFTYQDWRYVMYKENNGPLLYFIINFFGIHMFPTLLVYAGMMPMIPLFMAENNLLIIIGCLIILIGVSLEFFADQQMHQFLRTTKEKVTCRNGLWRYSRHPNYLGEITIWVGVYVSMIAVNQDRWYFLGFILMILLFEFISIPMMEKRQIQRRSDYIDYIKTTSRLLILPNRKSK